MTKKAILVLVILIAGVAVVWSLKKPFSGPTQNTTSAPTNSSAPAETSSVPPPSDQVKSPSQQAPVSSPVQPQPVAVSIDIANFAFAPKEITIAKGTKVTWTNHDGVAHTVTSDTGVFDSPYLSKEQGFTHTFNEVGAFLYHCTPHPRMRGTITVTK